MTNVKDLGTEVGRVTASEPVAQTLPRMLWEVEFVGRVEKDNACWVFLKELRREYVMAHQRTLTPCRKEELEINERAFGEFQSGMGTSYAWVRRIA
jgi:hypothetical protein